MAGSEEEFVGIVSTANLLNLFSLPKQVIQVEKLVGLPPPYSKCLGVYLRFRRAFAEVITFGGASAHKILAEFLIVGVKIGHLCFTQYKF